MTTRDLVLHPVQTAKRHGTPKINSKVTAIAYEVYSHIYKPQPAMIEGNCRGGFGCGELIAFLYAHSFPKSEWSARFDEALEGMQSL